MIVGFQGPKVPSVQSVQRCMILLNCLYTELYRVWAQLLPAASPVQDTDDSASPCELADVCVCVCVGLLSPLFVLFLRVSLLSIHLISLFIACLLLVVIGCY